MMKIRIFLALTTIILSSSVCQTALAETSGTSLSVSPSIIETKLEVGTKQDQAITVANPSDSEIYLRVYAENFTAKDEFGGMDFNTDSAREYSANTWLTFEHTNISVPALGKVDLEYSIEIPEEAENGEHYAVIFFEKVPSANTSENSDIAVNSRVGALLFITVGDDVIEGGRVLGASTDGSCHNIQCSFKTVTFREWGPVPFSFLFENTGNVHTEVSGKIEIFNIFNKKVAELPVDEKTVLAGSSRQFDATWLREPLLGKYTAKLSIIYGSGKLTEHAETSFWAVPWKLMLMSLAILVTIIVIFLIFRKFRARVNKKNTQQST